MYALAIVGGGPAGLSTALHLVHAAPALAGRIVVLERATYPREKHCAGAIGARAIHALERIGVDLRLGQSGGVPAVRIDAFEVDLGGARVRVREPAAAWVVRREALDAELAARVRARGVRILEGARVTGVVREAGRVLVTLEGKEPIATQAVVGADGIAGTVRRAIGAPRAPLHAQAIEVDSERTALDPPTDTIRFGFVRGLHGYVWDFPTPVGGRVLMSRGVYQLRDREDPAAPRDHLREHLQRQGLTLEGHRLKQLAERGWQPDAITAVPRVLLVGEAAGIDYPTGEGIAQAIAYGATAGPYLADALRRDRLGFADWQARWQAAAEAGFLRRRLLGGRALYGRWRAPVEHALARSPAVFQVVLRRFAGRPAGARAVALAAAQLGAGLLDAGLSAARW